MTRLIPHTSRGPLKVLVRTAAPFVPAPPAQPAAPSTPSGNGKEVSA